MLARRCWLALAAAALLACGGHHARQRAASEIAQRLAGTWDVRYDLDRPPTLTARERLVRQRVRGRIALLASRWLGASDGRVETPTDYGTYDVDFTPFGFEPRDAGRTPTALAGWLGGDSVVIAIGPEQGRAGVVMRGRLDADSIVGTWDVSIFRAAGGGGRFVMWRRPDGERVTTR